MSVREDALKTRSLSIMHADGAQARMRGPSAYQSWLPSTPTTPSTPGAAISGSNSSAARWIGPGPLWT